VTVVQKKVARLQWVTTNTIFRVGVTRPVGAAAFDSTNNQVNRPITYTSTDPSIILINTLGIVTPRAVGSAKLVATVDDKSDTLNVRVTQVPVASVSIDPITTTVEQGQVVTYRVTVRDSLNNDVTDRTVRWRSSNNNAAVVETPTGLTTTVRTIAPATVSITAIVDNVAGATEVSRSADLTVTATPIASIVVTPNPVEVRVGATIPISVATFDKNGKELLGRGGSVIARADDPSIASVSLDALNAAVRGLKAGSTKVTFYGIDAGLNPITPPVVITVNVSSQ
jgi:uncharacterized protein YjdB